MKKKKEEEEGREVYQPLTGAIGKSLTILIRNQSNI